MNPLHCTAYGLIYAAFGNLSKKAPQRPEAHSPTDIRPTGGIKHLWGGHIVGEGGVFGIRIRIRWILVRREYNYVIER